MPKTFFVPYAYDRISEKTGHGTKARCDALLDVVRSLDIKEPNFILTAGYSKESPAKPVEEAPESLAYQMCNYIYKQSIGFHQQILISWSPTAWGTLEETRQAAIRIAAMFSFGEDEIHVYISTNKGHMPRVRLCWKYIKRNLRIDKKLRLHFVEAHHSFSIKEWVQETIKFLQYQHNFKSGKW
ncbi:MAG: hypothetical protein V4473_02915 [Patescibacteria group bacterium]